MTAISTPELVGEACAAGIIGAFPTSNAASIAELNDWFGQIQDRRAASERPAGPIAASGLPGNVGSAGHTISAVHSRQSVAEVVDEIERGWHEAREATRRLL